MIQLLLKMRLCTKREREPSKWQRFSRWKINEQFRRIFRRFCSSGLWCAAQFKLLLFRVSNDWVCMYLGGIYDTRTGFICQVWLQPGCNCVVLFGEWAPGLMLDRIACCHFHFSHFNISSNFQSSAMTMMVIVSRKSLPWYSSQHLFDSTTTTTANERTMRYDLYAISDENVAKCHTNVRARTYDIL